MVLQPEGTIGKPSMYPDKTRYCDLENCPSYIIKCTTLRIISIMVFSQPEISVAIPTKKKIYTQSTTALTARLIKLRSLLKDKKKKIYKFLYPN